MFHWLLTGLIGFSWWSVKYDHIEWHIWSGIAILTLLIFRLLWGFFGSSTARFTSFVRGPRAVFAYLRDSRSWRAVGHSPVGALSVVALLGLTALQVATGLFNSDDDGLNEGPLAALLSTDVANTVREVHELVFSLLLGFVALHIASIVFYRAVLGRKLLGPMISGRAALDPDVEPMRPGRGWLAIVCLLVALGITRWIIAGAPPLGT